MFKVGDEVFVKGEVVEVMSAVPYPFKVKLGKGEDAYVFSNDEICSEDKIVKTYEMGLADAWELAKKILEMCGEKREEILGLGSYANILEFVAPEEALAKIEAYEKEKKIKVGDIVKNVHNGMEYIVLDTESGRSINTKFTAFDRLNIGSSVWKKTGKHIDIDSLLKQIGE